MTDEEFTKVFRSEQQRLVDLGVALCGDRAAAEDAVVEASARVLVRWRKGRVRNLGAYLRRALVNEVRSGQRRRKRAARRDDQWASGQVAPASDLGAAVTGQQQAIRLLNELPAGQRAVVALRFFDDRSEAETAEVLGISTGTVKSQTAKALNTLRSLLEVVADER